MHGPTGLMLRLADKTVHMCSAPLYVLSRVTFWYSSLDLVNMDHRHVLLLLGYHLKYSQQFPKSSTLLLILALWCPIALHSPGLSILLLWPTLCRVPHTLTDSRHAALFPPRFFALLPRVPLFSITYTRDAAWSLFCLCVASFSMMRSVQVHLHCHRPQNVLVCDTE